MKRKKSSKCTSKHALDRRKVIIKNYDEIPNRFRSKIDPLNLEEQKLQFLQHGRIPQFHFKVTAEKIEEISKGKRAEIEFDLLDEATAILEKVREKYGSGNAYIEQMYGERITSEKASRKVRRYLQQNGVDGRISVGWAKDLACSAKMAWHGPSHRPEARKFSLWLKDSGENMFLRERGILCLADHEIGTHFFRSFNDGFQPWFCGREKFGLKKMGSHRLLETEEGLAALNTLIQAKQKYLWGPALIYYTACKATTMSFEDLYTHLSYYIDDRELRWRYVMRVKRSLPDPSDVGGYGNDQCYFKGAVEILQNLDQIDFQLLYSGKISLDSLRRIRRMARLDCIRLPHFMQDMEAYVKELHHIAAVNGLKRCLKTRGSSRNGAQRHKKKKGKSGVGKKKRPSAAAKSPPPDTGFHSHSICNDDDDLGVDNDDESDDDLSDEFEDEDIIIEETDSRPGTCGSSINELATPTKQRQHPSFSTETRSPNRTFSSRDNFVMTGTNYFTPLQHLNCPTPPALSPLSTKSITPSQNTGSSPSRQAISGLVPAKLSSPVANTHKWGMAERGVSPLSSSMPCISSKYNRGMSTSTSPVPYSPHRWLLWRREKSTPNTLENSLERH